MSYPIDRKLVVAVSSSALFDLAESDAVWTDQGPRAYKQYQLDQLDRVLKKGVAFPFVRRFLGINSRFATLNPVEVVLLSRNSAATGMRVFRSIRHYGLDISRAAFMDGKSPYAYVPAFNASLFLSANENDVRQALAAGHPAGKVLPGGVTDDEDDYEFRIAFDFDGVVADDESETIYQERELKGYMAYESDRSGVPHRPGPLADLLQKLSFMQRLEDREVDKDPHYHRVMSIAIISARSAPAHERMITTLEHWGVSPNETFLLGGIPKHRILEVMRPHVFFDDQLGHLEGGDAGVPMVHIPFGIANVEDGAL